MSRIWLATFAVLAFAQDNPARLRFEVASIKPSKPGARGGGIKPMPGGQEYRSEGLPLKLIISLLYRVPVREILGGPEWLNSDPWDIQAKADHPYNIDDLHTMFQNLLADEFKLKFHIETKEGPVYALMVDKSGSKMKVDESPQTFDFTLTGGPGNVTVGKRESMKHFCWWLGQLLQNDQRPVIDQTGLAGNYDFTLSFAPEVPSNIPRDRIPQGLLDRPSIFDALRQQLGLKLEPKKGAVEYYVIESAEKPAAN